MRIKIIRLTIFSLFLIIALDLVYIQVVRGQYYHSLSVNNRIRVVPLEGIRGRIRDRNGIILADSRLAFNVSVIPQDLQDKDKLFDFLSAILNVEKKKLLQQFFQKKVTPFAPVVVAEDVDKKVAMKLEENKFRFPGLYIQESFRRRYPFKAIGSHALGYVGKINRTKIEKLKDYGYTQQSIVGYSGVEESYDQYLKGKEGGQQIEVNSRGQQVRLLSIREPERGEDIQLTIDSRVQQAAMEVMGDEHGTIIVMDLDSGGILGMISTPSYDPNVFTDSNKMHKANKLFVDKSAPMLNRAIKGQYPAGSVFKPIAAIGALHADKISAHTTFNCTGAYMLGRSRFRCAHVHGPQDLFQGIMHSCNVYFYNVGLLLGPDLLTKYAKMFGLSSPTHIDIPFEEKGNVPSKLQRKLKKQGWYKGDTLNFSIGQGALLTTPLQLTKMMATIARKGKEIQPHFIDTIGSQKIVSFSTVKNLKIKKEIFDIVQSGLRSVVTDSAGTARILNLEDFNVSGKTGTAQSVKGKPHHAWFVGYNTKGKENIAFCVFIEHGGSSYNACKMARELLKKMKEKRVL